MDDDQVPHPFLATHLSFILRGAPKAVKVSPHVAVTFYNVIEQVSHMSPSHWA